MPEGEEFSRSQDEDSRHGLAEEGPEVAAIARAEMGGAGAERRGKDRSVLVAELEPRWEERLELLGYDAEENRDRERRASRAGDGGHGAKRAAPDRARREPLDPRALRAVGCLPMSQQDVPPSLRLAAVCGLPCEGCSLFIGSHDDPARLQTLAVKTQRPTEQLRCEGCRSERRAAHCRQCEFVACAGTRGIDFCGQCAEYPCERLTSFQAAMPHRIELWEDQGRINAIGHERWLLEKRAHYSCPQCQTVNAAYDRRCWKCGHEPSCKYVELHRQALLDHPLTRA